MEVALPATKRPQDHAFGPIGPRRPYSRAQNSRWANRQDSFGTGRVGLWVRYARNAAHAGALACGLLILDALGQSYTVHRAGISYSFAQERALMRAAAFILCAFVMTGSAASSSGSYSLIDHINNADVRSTSQSAIPLVRVRWFSGKGDPVWRGSDLAFRPLEYEPLASATEGSNIVYTGVLSAAHLRKIESMTVALTATGTDTVQMGFNGVYLSIPILEQGKEHAYTFTRDQLGPWQLAENGQTELFQLRAERAARVEVSAIDVEIPDEELKDVAGTSTITTLDSERQAIFMHCPCRMEFPVHVPEGARLLAGLRAANGVASVSVSIKTVSESNAKRVLFSEVDSEPEWQEIEVDLSAYAAQDVTLALESESDNPKQVVFWSSPCIVRAEPGDAASPFSNMVLYLSDSLRADHLDAYGYNRVTAPYLTAQAERGVLFARCFSQDTCTQPSMTSLHTGVDYFVHQMTEDLNRQFSDSLVSFTELLRTAGYYTIIVTTNPYNPPRTSRPIYDEIAWIDSDSIVAKVAETLDRLKDRQFFLFIHDVKTHTQVVPDRGIATWGYRVPPPFDQKWALSANCLDIDHYDGSILCADDEFRQINEQIESLRLASKTLVVFLSDHGEAFGEHYGATEHGGDPYPEQIHVPLVFLQPGVVPAGRVINENVQLLDLGPTFLQVAGIAPPEQFQGQNLLPLLRGEGEGAFRNRNVYAHGGENTRSLSVIRDNHLYFCDLPAAMTIKGFELLSLQRILGPLPVIAGVATSRFAPNLQNIEGYRRQLFDLAQDPLCLENVRGQSQESAGLFAKAMRDHLATQSCILSRNRPPGKPKKTSSSAHGIAQEEVLAALGYLGVDRTQSGEQGGDALLQRRHLADMTDMFVAYGFYRGAAWSLQRLIEFPGRPQPVLDWRLRSLISRVAGMENAGPELYQAVHGVLDASPDDPEFQFTSGQLYEKQGDLEGAAKAYERVIERQPDAAPARLLLGDVLARLGRKKEALDTFRHVQSLQPQQPGAFLAEARLLDAHGDLQGAAEVHRKAAKVQPDDAASCDALGSFLEKTGNAEEAQAAFQQAAVAYQRALERTPVSASLNLSLGIVLGKLGRIQEALQAFRRADSLDPGQPSTYLALGALLERAGDANGALDAFRKAAKKEPDNTATLAKQVDLLVVVGDLDSAIEKCRQMLTIRPEDSTTWHRLGSLLAEKGQTDDALIAFQKTLALDPSDYGAMMEEGRLMERHGDSAGAIASYRKVAELRPTDSFAPMQLGMALAAIGDKSGAVEAFQMAAGRDPDSLPILASLSAALQEKGDLKAATRVARKMVTIQPDDVMNRCRLGKLLEDQGDHAGAMKEYRAAAAQDPNSPVALASQAALLEKTHDEEAAIDVYRKAIQVNPQDLSAHQRLATLLERRGDLDGALEALKNEERSTPDNPDMLFNQARILDAKGQTDVAATIYRRLTTLQPDKADPWLLLGTMLLRMKDFTGAVDAFRKAQTLDPKNIDTFLGEAHGLEQQSNTEGTLSAYQKALALRPDDVDLQKRVGELLEKGGDLEGALAMFRAIAEHEPTSIDAVSAEVRILLAQNEKGGAESVLREAIGRNSHNGQLWFLLASILQEQERTDEAFEAFRKARTLDSAHAGAWIGEGQILAARNDHPGAITAFRKATKFQPDNSWAWLVLGQMLTVTEQRGEALEAFRRALELDPRSVLGLKAAGQVASDLGRSEEANSYCQRLLDIDPECVPARLLLADLAAKRGDFSAAMRQFNQIISTDMNNAQAVEEAIAIIEKHPDTPGAMDMCQRILGVYPGDPQAHYLAGLILQDRKDFSGALLHFRKSLEADPENPYSFLHIGQVLEAQQDVNGALEAYQKTLQLDPKNQNAHERIVALERNSQSP